MVIHQSGFSPITSLGRRYPLHHLQPFTRRLATFSGSTENISVRIRFHSHVFSIEPQVPPIHSLFADEGGKEREFCPDRYELSKGLQPLLVSLIDDNVPSWISEDKNKKNHLAVCEAPFKTAQKYVIYYDLHPSKSRAGIDVEMNIKTAYLMYVDFSRTGKRERINALIRRSFHQKKRLPI